MTVPELRKFAKQKEIKLTTNGKYKTKSQLISELTEQKGGGNRKRQRIRNPIIKTELEINKLLNLYCVQAALRGERTSVPKAVRYVQKHKQGNNINSIAREMAKYKLDYLKKDD